MWWGVKNKKNKAIKTGEISKMPAIFKIISFLPSRPKYYQKCPRSFLEHPWGITQFIWLFSKIIHVIVSLYHWSVPTDHPHWTGQGHVIPRPQGIKDSLTSFQHRESSHIVLGTKTICCTRINWHDVMKQFTSERIGSEEPHARFLDQMTPASLHGDRPPNHRKSQSFA